MHPDENTLVVCSNCNNSYSGNFCPTCGQKNSEEKHTKSLRHVADEFLHGFFHYDGKIFKAIKYLIVKPGFLSEQYFKNRHQAFIKPFTLLILFTLFLYFFGLKLHILHQFSVESQIKNAPRLESMITHYVQKNQIPMQSFINEFDAYKTSWQKLFYTLIVPFLAIICSIVLIPKKRFFVDHLVFSIHLVCTYILLVFIYLAIIVSAQLIFHFRGDVQWGLNLLMLVFIVYTILGVKRAYSIHWVYSILAGTLLAFFVLLMDVGFHAMLVSYLTFFFNYIF